MEKSAQGIYIITTEDRYPTKVGVSGNLMGRVTNLQIGNWERIYAVEFGFVVGPRWADKPKNAFAALDVAAQKLETAVLRKMRELDLCLSGEWMSCTADDAWSIVRKVAAQNELEVVGIEILERLKIQTVMPSSLIAVFGAMVEAEQSARRAIAIGRERCGYLTPIAKHAIRSSSEGCEMAPDLRPAPH